MWFLIPFLGWLALLGWQRRVYETRTLPDPDFAADLRRGLPTFLAVAVILAIVGVPLALTDYSRTLDWIDASIAARRPGYICVAAVHTVMATQEDPELREAVLASDLTVPDGMPVVSHS